MGEKRDGHSMWELVKLIAHFFLF